MIRRALLSLVLLSGFAHATNYYVRTDGSDSNNGLTNSAGGAWLTINHANSITVAGDTVHVQPGTYAAAVTISASGTSGSPIVYISDTLWGAKIVVATNPDSCWLVTGSWVVVSGFDVTENSSTGSCRFALNNSTGSNVTFTANRAHDLQRNATISGCATSGAAGIASFAGSGVTNMLGNYIFNIGNATPSANCVFVHGIYQNSAGQIKNNIIFHNAGFGLNINRGSVDMVNNTIFNQGAGGIFIDNSGGTWNAHHVNNNLIFNVGIGSSHQNGISWQYSSDTPTDSSYTDNLVFQSSGTQASNFVQGSNTTSPTGSVQSNPLFVDYTGDQTGDYHLQAGSPAIKAGTPTDAPATDFDGNTQTSPPTIGALLQGGGGGGGGGQCLPAFGSYGPNAWPPACWTPYGVGAIWNIPVPANPTLNVNSATIVSTLIGIGNPFVTQFTYTAPSATPSTHDISHPTFWSKSSDPAYTVVSSSCTADGNPPAIPVGTVFHAPAAARPTGSSDAHMTVIEQATNTEYDFYGVPVGGLGAAGALSSAIKSCSSGNVVTGTGLGGKATAAQFNNLAGMVRGEEIAAGTINHALFLVAGCVDASGGVYPSIIAAGGFYQCARNGGGTNTGAPAMGALYWLDYTDAQIAALSIPAWQKTLALAFAHYGGYIGDTGGSSSPNMGFRFESDITYTQYGAESPVVGVAGVAGIPNLGNGFSFNPTGIDWAHHLHVLDPCVPLGMVGMAGGCPATGAPAVSLTPAPLNFGSVPVSTTVTGVATLKNTGTANLSFTASITGTNAAEFKIQSTTCSGVLSSLTSCSYTIAFTPTASGARSSSLTLNDNASGSPHQLSLLGTGGTVAITLNPSSLNFGVVAPGQCSASQTDTITSTGNSPLVISGGFTFNNPVFSFVAGGTCSVGQSLPPGSGCTAIIHFCPTATGAASGNLSIPTNAPGSPTLLPLSGSGGVSTATLSPATFTFPNQQVGTSSGAQAFTYSNSGTLALTGVAVSLTGSVSSFSQTNTCPASLPAGNSCTISVVFKPTAGGLANASISVASSAVPSPTTAALSGTGTVPATITLSPSSVSFANTLVGNFSAVTNVTVTNGGGATATISGVSVIGTNATDFTAGECATTASGFTDNFNLGALSSQWQIDTGPAPGGGTFSASNVDLTNGMLGLKVVQTAPSTSVGAEVRSTTAYGFGTYKWATRMASTATSPFATGTVPTGQVSSNFILNSSVSNPYTEIDSPEVTGNQPNLLQWTTWTTPTTNTALTATLANPELAFHLYQFKWTAPSVIFSADGTVSATSNTNIPFAPGNPMMNLWGTNGTFGGTLTAGTRWMFVKAFSFTPAGVSTLAAGASCTIPVYFSPLSAGTKSATLSVADNASGSPHQASLAGTATIPVASLTPATQTFSSQPVGTQSAPFNFTWGNTGTGPMLFTISLAGTDPGDYVLGANSCPNPLPGGQSCLIPVSFKPTTSGARPATLSIINSSNVTATASLAGTGVVTAPAVCLSTTSINFGNIPVNSTSGSLPITVTNCGTANLVVSGVTPTGDFTETNNCTTVIPGGTCTINGKFAPSAAGTRTGNFSIASNAASSPDLVNLQGFGTQAGATITATAPFGHVTVGLSSAPIVLTLTNLGNVSLTPNTPTITGAQATSFGFTGSCPSLAVNGTCTYSVVFTPLGTGAASATFTQSFAGGVTSVTSALSGTGDAAVPTLSLTPPSINFGNVQQGTPSGLKTIQLQNTSTTNLTVTSILPTGTNAADVAVTSHCGATPVTLPAGNLCSIDVVMTPSTATLETANVTVTSNAASSPDNVALQVTGTSVPTPKALLSPTALVFSPPSITKGSTSASQVVTLNNIGNANLLVSNVGLSGANASSFTETNNCGTVAPGSSCSATVNCAPTAAGALTASLVFTDNDPGVTQTATLTCTGKNGHGKHSIGVTSVNFNNQTVGTTSGPAVFTVTNVGDAVLNVSSVVTSGGFADTTNCACCIAIGASCSVSVTFTPAQLCGQFAADGVTCLSNVHLGQVTITDDDPSGPATVALQGLAIPIPPPPGPITITMGGVLVLGGHLRVGVQ